MNEKNIKAAIHKIEPEAGAKEWMFQNILKKANQTVRDPIERFDVKKKKKVPVFSYALPIAACFCILIIGIAYFIPASVPDSPGNSLLLGGNSIIEVDNASAFNEIGITLEVPLDASDVSYAIIDRKIALIHFVINGKTFEARASSQNGDFSGLLGTQLDTENIDAKNNAILYTISEDFGNYYKMTWTNGKVNYCLYGTDGATSDDVIAVYTALVHE